MIHMIQQLIGQTLRAISFAHALRIARAMKVKLYLVHIAETGDPSKYDDYPQIRQAPVQWNFLREGAPPEAIAPSVGIKVAT